MGRGQGDGSENILESGLRSRELGEVSCPVRASEASLEVGPSGL